MLSFKKKRDKDAIWRRIIPISLVDQLKKRE